MHRSLLVLLVIAGICVSRLAVAQPIASAPAEVVGKTAVLPEHPPAGLGGDLAFGWGGQRHGPTGWVARLEYEVFPVFGHEHPAGGVLGFQPGLEVWRSGPDNWGVSLPVAIVFGVRAYPARATVGVGFDAVLVDQVADNTGVGFWAPFAMARVGADVEGFQLGADARYGYRWQFGAPDHARWQLGIYLGKTWGTPDRKPFY